MADYAAYVLDDLSREKLLRRFPPKYPETVAHHITHKYGAAAADVPPVPGKITVAGYHDSGAIEVLTVLVDGCSFQATPGERRYYHITHSLDRAQGVAPKNSNDVLAALVSMQGEGALYNLPEPLDIMAVPQLLEDAAGQRPAQGLLRRLLGWFGCCSR
jgi:hypothetical protein